MNVFMSLSKDELLKIAKVLKTFPVDRSIDNLANLIDEILRIRHRIYTSTGLKIYVRKYPRYGDGWTYCRVCDLSYKGVNNVKIVRCPICKSPLRFKTRASGRR